MASTRVVLPWSTCATIATLRRSVRVLGDIRCARLPGRGETGLGLSGGASNDAERVYRDCRVHLASRVGDTRRPAPVPGAVRVHRQRLPLPGGRAPAGGAAAGGPVRGVQRGRGRNGR